MMKLTAALAGAVSFLAVETALACEANTMMTNEYGFVRKVVGLSDKIDAYREAAESDVALKLELLQPYFVICSDGEYYRITDVQADTVEQAEAGRTGFVLKSQVAQWTTREALQFSEVAFMTDRPEIIAWDDEAVLEKFMETGNLKAHGPAFREDLDSTRKRERSTRPYPVLGSQVRKLRRIKDKRVFNVLLPAALSEDASVVITKKEDVERVKSIAKNATIVLVFDATGSMAEFAKDVASGIIETLENFDPEERQNTQVGFVFYRDIGDEEKLVDFPPMPLNEAARELGKLATADYMVGGGDDPEPILDAMYYAATQYDWKSAQSGRRILIGVLNVDAKPKTIGGMDKAGKVLEGLDADQVANTIAAKSILPITVQASAEEGENLTSVLTTLAGGSGFINWTEKDSRRLMASRLANAMSDKAKEAVSKGTVVAGSVITTDPSSFGKHKTALAGYATIPLEILDGEMLERFRRNGIEFNIDEGSSGVLVSEGYIIENDDLLSPVIQIEKETMTNLIELYSVLGTAGVDSEGFRVSAAEAIAAIAGEDYDPDENISDIIEKKLGIKFPSELLDFNLEFLDSLSPGERLKFTKRIQDAGDELSFYLESNLAEFDENPAVYMPVAALP